jgi:hypothetical protein
MLEKEMADACFNYFLSKNGKYECIVREVPFLSRCIDLVLITREYQTITIEFKINNWRKALEQAKNHKLGADKSYICIPEKKPNIEFIKLLKQEKIGLFLYNPTASCIINEYYTASINKYKINIFNEMLINTTISISKKNHLYI